MTKLRSGPFPRANASWAAEIALDVEWAHAIAPAANIILVEASSTYLVDLIPVIDAARDGSPPTSRLLGPTGMQAAGLFTPE
jgi:hypothetical protein